MKFSHTLKTSAPPETIWAIWTDVEHWSAWDTELESSYLEGSFVLGATGKLTPKTGQVSIFTVSQFSPQTSHTITIKLPLCSLNVRRDLSIQADGTYFSHEVSFQGALAFVFGFLLGRQFQTVLPHVMENIKRMAEV